ncbi:MAG: hypothetical protein Q4D73_06215 [Actinomycetaceae bacterium]|nr:hypothetical protein [Actinomycetaceae bacterium]
MKLKRLASLTVILGVATTALTGCFGNSAHKGLQNAVAESSPEIAGVEVTEHANDSENLLMIVKLKGQQLSAEELKQVLDTVKAEAKTGYKTLSVNFYSDKDEKVNVCPLAKTIGVAPEDCVAGIVVFKAPEAK